MNLESQASLLLKLLKKKKIKLCSIESCSGGLFARTITSIAGASEVFDFGLITYSNESKMKFANVSKKDIDNFGAVSEKVCLSMSKNVLKKSSIMKSLCVACTGIAGPKGGTLKKPVGTLFVSVASMENNLIFNKNFKNISRKKFQINTVLFMFKCLIKIIEKY
tara:strand:- start:1244 stop:1735 length:492 start_codon:yes stop_codon:yes gene_type:complete